jgi:hypothetical protein
VPPGLAVAGSGLTRLTDSKLVAAIRSFFVAPYGRLTGQARLMHGAWRTIATWLMLWYADGESLH